MPYPRCSNKKMKDLVIHAGFHKSGTTALQESFHLNREQLLKLGINYPTFGHKAHHRLAWSLSQKPWGWAKRGGQREPKKTWDSAASYIEKAKSEKVILSSEFFSELNGDQIRKIYSSFKNRDIKILFTLRPLAKLLPSSYQQYLKYGITADYEEWLHSVLDNPGESKINPTFWQRHNHGQVIARWADVFGSKNITVLIVNEAQPTFLFDEINRYLELPENTLQAADTGSNRSLTMEEIALLRELNRQFPKDRDWDEYQVYIRYGYIRELTDRIKPAPDKAKLLTPDWAISKANEIGSRIKSEVISSKVNVIGDLNTLENSQVPSGNSDYPQTIDIKTVAAAMLHFNKYTADYFPEVWLRRSYRKRFKKYLRSKLLPKRR
jgi:hypothetical protein